MFTSQKEVLFVRTFYYVTPVANLDFLLLWINLKFLRRVHYDIRQQKIYQYVA